MDTFRWITVVVSTILGLGIARLLTSAVLLFHSRKRAKLDWVPVAWAVAVFAQHIGFWWSLEELSSLVPKWTLAGFLLLVGLVLALFLSAALILPSTEIHGDDRLSDFFEEDGRYALLALAGFNLFAILANWAFWRESILTQNAGENVALALLAGIAFAAPRKARVVATLTYVPLLIALMLRELPTSY
ncbi:MAG: hypothetical protein U1E62_07420 [Alsobacter sp.]